MFKIKNYRKTILQALKICNYIPVKPLLHLTTLKQAHNKNVKP